MLRIAGMTPLNKYAKLIFMKFSIKTLLWIFALLASAVATFGSLGVIVAFVVLICWIKLYRSADPSVTFVMIVFSSCIVAICIFTIYSVITASTYNYTNPCGNTARNIAISLAYYQDRTKNLPPTSLVDDDGNPMHSWRTLILPELELSSIHSKYRFNEPWNSAHNKKLCSENSPNCLVCPIYWNEYQLRDSPNKLQPTHFFAINDDRSMWQPSVPNSQKPTQRRRRRIRDGEENTVMLIEVTNLDAGWSEPRDLTFDEAVEALSGDRFMGHISVEDHYYYKIRRCHGRFVVFADGHVSFLSRLKPEIAKALLTENGGEDLDTESTTSNYPQSMLLDETVICYDKIISNGAFLVVCVLPAFWLQDKRSESPETEK